MLLEQEETYWLNRSHEQWLLKGDNNTSYFHKIANGRKRKSTIISLENEGLIIKGDENLLNHAIEYYSKLFGPEESHDIHLDSSIQENQHRVSEENSELCRPFSEQE